MKKEELRTAIQEMNTYQFGQKKELTNKLSKVTSYVAKQEVLDMVSNLDKEVEDIKPELPVIPHFVADYIESATRENATLLGAMDHFLNSKEIKSWMRVNQELFAKAWLSKDGYTIEPEKKYILKNKRGFVASIQVEQSYKDLTTDISLNYTPYQQVAYKFSQKEKEFYKDSFYLEEDEVTNK